VAMAYVPGTRLRGRPPLESRGRLTRTVLLLSRPALRRARPGAAAGRLGDAMFLVAQPT
jgi:hypothetical protein